MTLNKRSFVIATFLSIVLLSTPITMFDAFAQQSDKNPRPIPTDENNSTPKDSKAKKTKDKHDRMKLKAEKNGKVRVIVELDADFKSKLTNQEKIEKKQTIKNKQKSLKDSLKQNGIFSIKNLKHTPFVVMVVNPAVLDELVSSGLVRAVHEDVAASIDLFDTIPKITADTVHTSGITGTGNVVAILDTGVDRNHDFFTNGAKIVSEACYSGSGCPLGATGTGSAAPCNVSDNAGCIHGTHVAGIAAGNHNGVNPKSGVAKGADIVAINVATINTGPGCPADPQCLDLNAADIALGLDRVLSLKNGDDGPPINIVAVNLSLGDTFYTQVTGASGCESGPMAVTIKPSIDALESVGIVTIASSGNNGQTNAIKTPACISNVISVGSTDKNDVVPWYSNESDFLDLLAPGGNHESEFNDSPTDTGITSSVPGNSFDVLTGTSMAAPHVTGAWALLKEAFPGVSNDKLLYTLKNSGVPILEPTAGLTKPRIHVQHAIDALTFAALCGDGLGGIGRDIDTFDNFVFGTSGNDRLSGLSSNGVDDDDLIIAYDGNDSIKGNDGNDCLFGGNGVDKLSGGNDDDYLNAGDDADSLNGGEGSDYLYAGPGNDILYGGTGNFVDYLYGDDDDDSLQGVDGNDFLYGGAGDDILSGGIGDDELHGDGGDDFIYGREDNDTIFGGVGFFDICIGGSGGDTITECSIVG